MAHAAGTSARTHRLIGLLAALLLAATTALAFGRVFLGTASSLQLVGAAVAAAGLAVAFERRSLLLSTAASAAGLALAIGLIVFPETTWYGMPTADTLRATLDAAAVVGEQARIQAAPAEPIAPLLLAAVVSLWAAVFSAHALAFRAGSPLLGLIPPVALVAFADTVLEEFVKPLYGVAFLAAALLVVFADGLARVQGWGPIWSSSRRGVARSASRGARRLAVTALGAAVLAPIFVPGFGSKAIVDFGTPADGSRRDRSTRLRAELSDPEDAGRGAPRHRLATDVYPADREPGLRRRDLEAGRRAGSDPRGGRPGAGARSTRRPDGSGDHRHDGRIWHSTGCPRPIP